MADADTIQRLNAALEGRYRIERELGAGGMATVYLAEDVRHHRHVALKVLKSELAAVLGSERFLTEIETTANLQHPHILPLFDSGEADGFLFYVMPYVDGESLRQRLDREHQLPVDEAVNISSKLANALDYAHRHGVIHRDIKPANILLHDGEPVVADFGIALAVSAGVGDRLTETGLSLGTPHYMSPEQATGDQNVGAATDIYALGCVLYEMLAGEPPFTGSTPQAVLGKIVVGSPAPITEHRKAVPAYVEAVTARALEKVPADRFRTAADFARALRDLGFRHGAPTGGTENHVVWMRTTIAASAMAVVFAVLFGWALTRPSPEMAKGMERFTVELGHQLRAVGAIPDGSGVVFAKDGQLYVRRWRDLTPTPIAGATGERFEHTSSVSPGGDSVAFVSDGTLRVVPISGGAAQAVASNVYCCTHWAEDGYIYYSHGFRSVFRVPAIGGEPSVVLDRNQIEDVSTFSNYAPVPGTDIGVYSAIQSSGGTWVEAVRRSTGERVRLVPGLRPRVTSTGHLVYATERGELHAAPFDVQAVQLTGPAFRLDDAVFVARGIVPVYDLTGDGRLVYRSGAAGGSHELVWVTREGTMMPVDAGESFNPGTGHGNIGWALSPDGRHVAFGQWSDGNEDIWVKRLPDGPPTRLTFHDARDLIPGWTHDGQRVSFASDRNGTWSTFTKRADGSGQAEPLLGGLMQASWGPAGEWIAARSVVLSVPGRSLSARDLFAVDLRGDSLRVVPFGETPQAETSPKLSPDGRWLAYVSDETGSSEVYVRGFPDPDSGRWRISSGGGSNMVWSRDGQTLYFVDSRRMMTATYSVAGSRFVVDWVTELFSIPPGVPIGGIGHTLDIALDGRFLMAREYAGGSAVDSLVVVRSFVDDLGARARR